MPAVGDTLSISLFSMLRPIVVFFCRGVFFWGGLHWLSVKGKRATSQEAPIVALSPHSSYFDSVVVTYLDLTSVVAKSESEYVPIFGSMNISFLHSISLFSFSQF